MLALAGAACGGGDASERAPRTALDDDPAVARFQVTELAGRGCDGLVRAAEGIRARSDRGAAWAGLVEAAAESGRDRCFGDAAPGALWRAAPPVGRLILAALVDDRPELARTALWLSPPGPTRDRMLGARLLAAGRADEAVAVLRPAAAGDARARTLLLRALIAAGEVDDAAALAASLAPSSLDEAEAIVRALAAAGHLDAVRASIAAAPVPWRGRLAAAAAAIASPTGLATDDADPALLRVAGERLLASGRAAEAARVLRRAAEAAPGDGDALLRLGDALAASGAVDAAVDAYDQAGAAAPASAEPMRRTLALLALRGRASEARRRAAAIARAAADDDADALERAALAHAAAGQPALAADQARRALAARPGDGRLAFLHAGYLEAAGAVRTAAARYAALLVCGARGQPWHRHEVSARLVRAARAAELEAGEVARLLHPDAVGCQPVAGEDLEIYVRGLAEGLAGGGAAAPAAGAGAGAGAASSP